MILSNTLSAKLSEISQKCIKCELCVKECAFLRRYGKPKDIADQYDSGEQINRLMAFECSLCQLCTAVCPVGINPSGMFLEMRCDAITRGDSDFDKYKHILTYEMRGISKRYTWYGLPEKCDTVFFPGCALPGTRPDKTIAVFELMQKKISSLGIVLDCCTNISHDLGRKEFFLSAFGEMKQFLIQNGVKTVIAACPTCYKIFDQYGESINVKSIYEFIADQKIRKINNEAQTVTIHDPCALRFNGHIQDDVRRIVSNLGLAINEMPRIREKTLCCGGGGSVKYLSCYLSEKWADVIKQEQSGNRVITYCAGCASSLGKSMPVSHIIDLFFDTNATLAGKIKVYKSPMTYLNRINLKRRLKKILKTVVSYERAERPF
ncbi:MAG: (Fe-S)-binding protein [Proteobacteria bacterium]|nr:(Fe-S)-binding protein [Pseudomonadota bacterium]MBU4036733.1 (Fe-S)-binding protein [Pseudomonadota bacterium]